MKTVHGAASSGRNFPGRPLHSPRGYWRKSARTPGNPRPPKFQTIRGKFETPEDINDSPDTAPSKRILDLYRGYRKPLMGSIAMQEIGLDTVRGVCPLFDRWVEALERQARA